MSDRSAAVSVTIIAIVTDALRQWLRGDSAAGLGGVRAQVESLLRDEFADIKREAAADRTLSD